MARAVLHPDAEAKIAAAIDQALEAMALAGAEQLDINTSSTSGSGRKYPRLPHTSSAPHEYPVEQYGDLNDSIDVHKSPTPHYYVVGFFGEPMGKLIGLEFKPLARGGRKPIARTMSDPETHRAMKRAVEGG